MLSKIFLWMEVVEFSGFSVGHHNLVYPPGIIWNPNKNSRTISNGTSTARNNDTNNYLQSVLFTNQRTTIISLDRNKHKECHFSKYFKTQLPPVSYWPVSFGGDLAQWTGNKLFLPQDKNQIPVSFPQPEFRTNAKVGL